MARMPGAEWRGHVPYNSGDGDRTPLEAADAIVDYWHLVEHIADGSYLGTISWQHNDNSNVSSHFTVAKDGRIAQLVDTHDRAWTQIKGNPRAISIENEGFTGQALTPQQIEASALIFAWVHMVHGIPLQLTGDPNRKGLGHHSMGAESGIEWGHSECPGPKIIAQKPAILARAIELVAEQNGDTDMRPYLRIKHAKYPHVFAVFGNGGARWIGPAENKHLNDTGVLLVTSNANDEVARIAAACEPPMGWPPQPVA